MFLSLLSRNRPNMLMANTCKFNTRLVKKNHSQNSDIFIYIKMTDP